MNPPLTYRPVSAQVHDVAIFGAGYAGYAAARALVAAGKSVLLIDRRAALVAESGWAFQLLSGESTSSLWGEWQNELTQRSAAANGLFSGGCCEVIANEWLKNEREKGTIQVLYYSTPLAVEADSNLHAVLLGTKSGLLRVAARQWIDATETGELTRLLATDWKAPEPQSRQINLMFRNNEWKDISVTELNGAVSGLEYSWNQGFWEHERVLTITSRENQSTPRSWWVPSLKALHSTFPDAIGEALLTHGSIDTLNIYAPATTPKLPANVLSAAPWLVKNPTESLLAGRFDVGLAAVNQLNEAATGSGEVTEEFGGEIIWQEETSSIAVAGLGTGGALATLAAARQGSDVVGFDPLPFCGGIGAGGGIHWYYFGVKGGLQEELDTRMREIAPLFATRGQVHGYHPDSKKCALEALIGEAGARLIFGATLIGVQREGRRIVSAMLSTPQGAVRLSADAWIDSTGDGDLAARGGAGVRLGRDGDGLVHAYTQSSGRSNWRNDKPYLQVVNYDSGYTNATDVEDLTRARIMGLTHYLQGQFTEIEHPLYIAPAIGIRQSRHIDTDYVLELNDQIERRRFHDSVGLAGCHFDNHAQDFEMESDEAMFLTWACRGLRALIGSEIPYRILLPGALDNVWLACRAIGVSQDAHHSLRMQRDMQRIGEAAGIAAAIAPNGNSRDVDLPLLQNALRASGALGDEDIPADEFGPATLQTGLDEQTQQQIDAWFESLESGKEGLDNWRIYRAALTDDNLRQRVLALLNADDDLVAWRAAAIAAMLDEPSAETNLLGRINKRHEPIPEREVDSSPWNPPYWFVSLSLLRRVISKQSLPVLQEIANEENLLHNIRTSVALCCEALANREQLSTEEIDTISTILTKLIEEPASNSIAPPQHAPLTPSHEFEELAQTDRRPVREDLTWQIHLSIARARRALGSPPHEQALAYLQDDRSLVRRAFGLAIGIETPIAV